MVTPIVGAGTPEPDWAAWPALAQHPPLDLTDAGTPLIVAPHPDDEVLGAGGLMTMLGRAHIVAVTEGEASHPDSRRYHRSTLARMRRDETDTALKALGLADADVFRLGQPDGGIDEPALVAALEALLAPGRWCVATWRQDGHPDHEAVGRAAAAACDATGARLLEYPVWMWHWARPGDPRVPWQRIQRVDLPPAACAAKADAITAFRSQTEPLGPSPADAAILPPATVAHFRRPFEVFLT